MTKKVVLRKDVVSKQLMAKENLIRIVRTQNAEIKIDWLQNLQGRGAYIQKDLLAIKKAQQTNALARGLRTKVDQQIYEELIKALR